MTGRGVRDRAEKPFPVVRTVGICPRTSGRDGPSSRRSRRPFSPAVRPHSETLPRPPTPKRPPKLERTDRRAHGRRRAERARRKPHSTIHRVSSGCDRRGVRPEHRGRRRALRAVGLTGPLPVPVPTAGDESRARRGGGRERKHRERKHRKHRERPEPRHATRLRSGRPRGPGGRHG